VENKEQVTNYTCSDKTHGVWRRPLAASSNKQNNHKTFRMCGQFSRHILGQGAKLRFRHFSRMFV
jgi:hypothetical protein